MMTTTMIAGAAGGIAAAITTMATGGAGAMMITIAGGGAGTGVTMMTMMIDRRG